jgi:lipoprotein-anchoring transpeptidase ErfK/SrfK
VLGSTYFGHPVTIYERVTGEMVEGIDLWYRIGADRYISAAYVSPFIPQAPEQYYEGRWVDVSLSTFYAVAYEGSTPVYVSIITAGRENRTPPGVYEIFHRVENETMDSATVGIPKGHPEYYYLENVKFSQYFRSGGFAIHGNYWTPPGSYGSFTSNGCIGMMNHDAEWFWNFLGFGSVVSIHY